MVTAKLYIECGGEGTNLGARFREGWSKLLDSAGVRGKTKIVRGGGRRQTFKRFAVAVLNHAPGIVPFLLVDSEYPVESAHSAWVHLRKHDGWVRPKGAGGDQAFLMVQVMETWLLSDPKALRNYFGAEFKENWLKAWPDLEDASKKRVLEVLGDATASCRKCYSKGEVSFELLGRVDSALVEAKCPRASAFLKKLRAV